MSENAAAGDRTNLPCATDGVVSAFAEDLNAHNDAFPLARPSQAAALPTLAHEDKIRARVKQLREWTEPDPEVGVPAGERIGNRCQNQTS